MQHDICQRENTFRMVSPGKILNLKETKIGVLFPVIFYKYEMYAYGHIPDQDRSADC